MRVLAQSYSRRAKTNEAAKIKECGYQVLLDHAPSSQLPNAFFNTTTLARTPARKHAEASL